MDTSILRRGTDYYVFSDTGIPALSAPIPLPPEPVLAAKAETFTATTGSEIKGEGSLYTGSPVPKKLSILSLSKNTIEAAFIIPLKIWYSTS